MKKEIFIGGKKCAFSEKKVKALEERLGKCGGIFRSWRDRELYIFQDTALSALSRADKSVLIFQRGFKSDAEMLTYSVITVAKGVKEGSDAELVFEDDAAKDAFIRMLISADAIATYMEFFPYVRSGSGAVDYETVRAEGAMSGLSTFIEFHLKQAPDKELVNKAMDEYFGVTGDERGAGDVLDGLSAEDKSMVDNIDRIIRKIRKRSMRGRDDEPPIDIGGLLRNANIKEPENPFIKPSDKKDKNGGKKEKDEGNSDGDGDRPGGAPPENNSDSKSKRSAADPTHVMVPDGVERLWPGTFFNDELVEVITLPSTLARIDHTSIAGCPSLRMVVFNGTVEEWESIPKSIYWIDCDVPVKCKDDYAEK